MTTLPAPVVTTSPQKSIYDHVFWIAYAANLILVTGNVMTFRFADWVVFLGGTNSLAGFLVSAGTLGALFSRLGVMHIIDRHGVRGQWMICSLMFSLGIIGIVSVSTPGILLAMARLCYAIGIAGMFTCSVIHIQVDVPAHRRTEIIGVLGSSGFLGMVCGGLVGDLIFKSIPPGREAYQGLFAAAAIMGVIYLFLITYITREDEKPDQPPLHNILQTVRQYSPGYVLMIASIMGMGFAVIFVFLTRYATAHNLTPGTFYAVYALAAFGFRLMTKNWNRFIGRHQMIIRGLIGHIIGHISLSFATEEWHFILPAITCGFGHALLFPAVISLGSGAFPQSSRGVGTTLAMGFIDVGSLVFAPLLGSIIDYGNLVLTPLWKIQMENFGFQCMFWTSIASHLLVLAIYSVKNGMVVDPEQVTYQPKPANPDILPINVTTSEATGAETILTSDSPETIKFPVRGKIGNG
jgi:MFS family permease